jgi:hypothetical protein
MAKSNRKATLASRLTIGLIKKYQQFLSPLLGNNCRFDPTCSNYGVNAIQIHGFVKGSWLTTKRILKCHPLNSGGYDPVPQSTKSKKEN